MSESTPRSAWSSRLGFILAAAGSSVGLGAIWKFPYMAGTNGGSIFMLPTIAFALTIGLALLMTEMCMGRTSRGGAGTAFRKLGTPLTRFFGPVSVLTGALVLGFYSVVGGWCTHYLLESLTGNLASDDPQALRAAFEAFAADPYVAAGCHVLFLSTTALVVLAGVQKGIERVGKVLMPLLFILMLVLIGRGLTLPGAMEGVKFLFKPDWEAFTGEALLNAMGFAFFSLSVGSGSMMNYGSYLSKDVNIGPATLWIVVLAVMASVLGGLMIMPAVFAFGDARRFQPHALGFLLCRPLFPVAFRRGLDERHLHSRNGFSAFCGSPRFHPPQRRFARCDRTRDFGHFLRPLLRPLKRRETFRPDAF